MQLDCSRLFWSTLHVSIHVVRSLRRRPGTMPQCATCGDLRQSISAANGVELNRIKASAPTCLFCDLLRIVVAKFHKVREDDFRLGWDLSRMKGLRVVV